MEAVQFIRLLAQAKARDSPPLTRRSSEFAWERHWTRIIAVACARSFASSLVHPVCGAGLPEVDVGRTDAIDLFAELR